jgi:glyoxylase-like metal-dependent hydrolase (beta-lactamase superfamily II)
MDLTPFHFTEILPDLFVYPGAANTGVLRCGERAVLIDCDDTLTPERLAELGIQTVERIYCTQHRRPNTAGIPHFQAAVHAPQAERQQFEEAAAYWQDWRSHWHLYHFRPGPLAPLHDIPIQGTVSEGDVLEWGGFTVRVLDTPGMTGGAVSYIVERSAGGPGPAGVTFCGDALYGPGQVWDVHSLQNNMGGYSDYHGFLGAARTLIASLEKLAGLSSGSLVPSHGGVVEAPTAAARLTIQRLEQLYRNYAATSALNFYFPHIFQDLRDDPWRMAPAQVVDFPGFILPVAATSFAIRSETGGLFLIDCGSDSVLETLAAWKEQGQFADLEGCWVTHYHDDHVDALHHLAASTSAPIYADEHLAEILAHPARFCLPCLSPAAAPLTHVTTDGETWRWREFKLTALHFPGQTLYHGGLLVRGRGLAVLFGGDSFAPTGLDDYTAGNRNFLGPGQGYRRCIDLIRRYRPDLILNQHQRQAFHFSDEQLDYMEQMLAAREALLAELLPWDHPNHGTDAGWIRAYPYTLDAGPGATCVLEVRATEHSGQPHTLDVEAVLPPGWEARSHAPGSNRTETASGERIARAPVSINIPPTAGPGSYPVAFRVTWNGQYLGQVCHAIVNIW